MRDAKTLLLVDHEQAQVFERHSAREQPVRSNHHVDGAVGQSREGLLGLRVVNEATEQRHFHREASEPVGQECEVLAREQRRRHEHGRLASVLHGLENRSDRDLGLAEADVGADKSVHGARKFHVGLDVVNGLGLVRGQCVGEEVLHFALPLAVTSKGVADGDVALAVQVDQFLRHEEGRRASFGARLLPLGAAHTRQRGVITPGVRGERVNHLGGPVTAAVLELENQIVARCSVDGSRRRTRELRDAVLAVHDETAHREVIEESVDVARTSAHGAVHAASTREVALAPHHDLGVINTEARRERTLKDGDAHVEHFARIGGDRH